MKLIFEKSAAGAGTAILPECDVEKAVLPPEYARETPPRLPETAESEIGRHYTALAKMVYGVNNGFYPLGSCTMKYNPAVNEEAAALPGFADIHPLQPEHTVQGCLEALYEIERCLCEATGMDAMSFQPAAGAHGELTGLMMIKAYHESKGESYRRDIIIPDSAHGTNPASVSMAGFRVIHAPSGPNGEIDLDKFKTAIGPNTAGFMLTNPNTLGLFERNAAELAEIVHEAGGLVYYDGANLNAVMGVVRPGDMGFDVLHLNLHKSFSTPHGGGGPGSGPVGCKAFLAPFLPAPRVIKQGESFCWNADSPQSIGRVKSFHGNFLVAVRALTYIMTLGGDGITDAAKSAVLNANYLMKKLTGQYDAAYPGGCMHEFVLTLEKLKKRTGVAAVDVAKAMIDAGIHPPTMYFPLIVHEALMFEPTETETKETLDEVAAILSDIYEKAFSDPDALRNAPVRTPVGRPDEAAAARNLVLRY